MYWKIQTSMPGDAEKLVFKNVIKFLNHSLDLNILI